MFKGELKARYFRGRIFTAKKLCSAILLVFPENMLRDSESVASEFWLVRDMRNRGSNASHNNLYKIDGLYTYIWARLHLSTTKWNELKLHSENNYRVLVRKPNQCVHALYNPWLNFKRLVALLAWCAVEACVKCGLLSRRLMIM